MAERIPMIALSPTMDTGTVARWRRKVGDVVKSGDVLCEVETDKATMDYESTVEGTLLAIVVPEGSQAAVGDTIAIVGKPGEDVSALAGGPSGASAPVPPPAPSPAPSPAPPPAPAPAPGSRVRSSPLARRLAAERGIDLASVHGSGPGGRVVLRDLEPPFEKPSAAAAGAAGAAGALAPATTAAPLRPGDRIVPVTRMRRTIARRLSESMSSAPHFYLTVTVDAANLQSMRGDLTTVMGAGGSAGATAAAAAARKVSLNAIMAKLAADALRRHPSVNASWNGDTITLRGTADVAIAVALEDGLVAPVVRDCGAKPLLAIDAELADLVARAKAGRLAPAEYEGAGFTISNLGSYGIEEFTAIINPPGSAILAVGAIQRVPVAGEGDRIEIRPRMKMTLSCDHRVVDGATGAAFLASLKDAFEHPLRALL